MTKRSPPATDKSGYDVGYRKPPASGRFKKGRSGNPKGRPGKTAFTSASPFDLVLEKTLTINRDGRRQEVTPEEALQHTLLQNAFAGKLSAIRRVLKMIQQRQAAIAESAPAAPPVHLVTETPDPYNATEALLLLGIGKQDPTWSTPRLKLLPWAMQAALDRRRKTAVALESMTLLRNSVLAPDEVRWPGRGHS